MCAGSTCTAMRDSRWERRWELVVELVMQA
jgi:hypothetical protein